MTTAYDILSTAIPALVEQGSPCVEGGRCRYLDSEGNRCVAGWALTQAEVDRLVTVQEGVRVLSETGILPERLVPHTEVLARLQSVHDDWSTLAGRRDLSGLERKNIREDIEVALRELEALTADDPRNAPLIERYRALVLG